MPFQFSEYKKSLLSTPCLELFHETLCFIECLRLALCLQPQAFAAETDPAQVNLDYAYYSPVSLVLKHFGWLEQALPHTKVGWVLSQGSNRSLEYLNSGGVDFASSASLSAVLSRANGSPIKSVYVYSRAEWTALVVRKDSPLNTVTDLKGKNRRHQRHRPVPVHPAQPATGRAEKG